MRLRVGPPIRGDHHHHGRALAAQLKLTGWWFSIASTRAPATTARRRSAPASAGRNTICASRPTARSTRRMPRSAWPGCIAASTPKLDAMLARIQNDLFDLGADLARPTRAKPEWRAAAHRSTRRSTRLEARDRRAERGVAAAPLLRAARRNARRPRRSISPARSADAPSA